MYKPFNTFLFRAPLHSFDLIQRALYDEDSLASVLKEKRFQEAIYIASPVLYKELQKYLKEKFNDKEKKERLQNSLIKYLSRMSTRCTPFGQIGRAHV